MGNIAIIDWRNALNGGHYEQAQGVLHTADGKMCCLGVACDVWSKQTGKGRWVRENGRMAFELDGQTYAHMPPFEVQKWLGLTQDQLGAFAVMNDTAFANFTQIAAATVLLN